MSNPNWKDGRRGGDASLNDNLGEDFLEVAPTLDQVEAARAADSLLETRRPRR